MNSRKPVVYIANPSGFSDAGRLWLAEVVVPKLASAGFEVINPFDQVMGKTNAELRNSMEAMSHNEAIGIGTDNFAKIDGSGFIFAILDGTDVDSGTSIEIGYGYARGKKVVGYRGDFRATADAGACKANLQVETAIELSGGHIHYDIGDAVAELERLALGQ